MGEVRRREGEINCTEHYGQSIYIKFQNLHRLLSGIWGQLRLEILRLVYFIISVVIKLDKAIFAKLC